MYASLQRQLLFLIGISPLVFYCLQFTFTTGNRALQRGGQYLSKRYTVVGSGYCKIIWRSGTRRGGNLRASKRQVSFSCYGFIWMIDGLANGSNNGHRRYALWGHRPDCFPHRYYTEYVEHSDCLRRSIMAPLRTTCLWNETIKHIACIRMTLQGISTYMLRNLRSRIRK